MRVENTPIWERAEFPTQNVSMAHTNWVGKGKAMTKPFSWTPIEPFTFGGKTFIALYPCIAFETKNFGWVCQKTWDGVVMARE